MQLRASIITAVLWMTVGLDAQTNSTSIKSEEFLNISRSVASTYHLKLWGDALYWSATEPVDWAYTIDIHSNTEDIKFKTISFDWSPGFKVGLGYDTAHDLWDIQIYYTRFRPHASGHIGGGEATVTSAFLGNKNAFISSYKSGHIRFNIHFNVLDGDLGRSFLISHAFSVRPVVGIKMAAIHQTLHTIWKTPQLDGFDFTLVAHENLKNNFYGIGPKGGMSATWIWGNVDHRFVTLFGDFSAAYMGGHWALTDKFHDNFFNTEVVVKTAHHHLGALVLQGYMGLGADWNFNHNHIALKLGYEIQNWFNQYQIVDNLSGGHNNNLILQGVTFHLSMDF